MATMAIKALLSPLNVIRQGRKSLVRTHTSSPWHLLRVPAQKQMSSTRPTQYCMKKGRVFHSSRQHNLKSSESSSGNKKTETTGNAASTGATGETGPTTMWETFLGPKPMPERNTANWYKEMLLICTVFGITGSSTMVLVRPAVSEGLGIRGTLKDGPWSYRICSVVIMTPIYATLLVAVGTLFGRHAYFRHFSVKIFSRFGIPPEVLDSSFHKTKATFRKCSFYSATLLDTASLLVGIFGFQPSFWLEYEDV